MNLKAITLINSCPNPQVKIGGNVCVSVNVITGGGSITSVFNVDVIDGTTYNIPAGKKLDSVSVIPETGDRVLTIGYTYGSGEIIDAEEIISDTAPSFPRGMYFHNGQTIHFSGFVGQVKLYII